jgi:hypothetical protein
LEKVDITESASKLLILVLVGLLTRDQLRTTHGAIITYDKNGDEIWDLDDYDAVPVVPPVVSLELGYTRLEATPDEDLSPDVGNFHYDGMELKKWGKIYSRSPKEGYLLLERLHPSRRGNSMWSVVDRKFKVFATDVRDSNIKMTRGNLVYRDFPGITTAQEEKVLKASAELVKKANEVPSVGSRVVMSLTKRKKSGQAAGVVDVMEWATSFLVAAWTQYQFGLAASALFVGWRTWQFLDLSSKVAWSYTKVRDFVDTIESANDAYEQIKVEYDAGNLKFVAHIFYVILSFYVFVRLVLPLLDRFRIQVVTLVSPGGTPERTPPGTPGGDGMRYGVSLDESEEEEDQENPMMKRMARQQDDLAVAMTKLAEKMEKMESQDNTRAPTSSAGYASSADSRSESSDPSPEKRLDLDRLFSRLVEHEDTVDKDAETGKAARRGEVSSKEKKKKKGKEKDRAKDEDGSDGSDIELDSADEEESLEKELKRLEDAAMNPRTALLKKLRKLRKVKWTMPGGRKARVAPKFLARLYAGDTTASEKLRRYLTQKDMKGSAAGEKMLQLAYLLDRMVKEDNDDLVNMESVEMICRTLYGMQKAFMKVKERSDWERPKSLASGSKWESKVSWELFREYDIMPEDDDAMPEIDSADTEAHKRLQRRALLSKHLGSLTDGVAR